MSIASPSQVNSRQVAGAPRRNSSLDSLLQPQSSLTVSVVGTSAKRPRELRLLTPPTKLMLFISRTSLCKVAFSDRDPLRSRRGGRRNRLHGRPRQWGDPTPYLQASEQFSHLLLFRLACQAGPPGDA